MNSKDFIADSAIYEAPVDELAHRLPSLKKHDYTTIDDLVRKVSEKHKVSHNALRNLFTKKFGKTPDHWISGRLDETNIECDLQEEVDKFCDWACSKLNIKQKPKIELSMDTDEAQTNHHTGSHVDGENSIWVYAKNRNLVDILRTVFHELVHVRQGQLGMIKPNSSYPGSPIEVMADMLAGKYMKIYGKKHRHIFQ